MPATVWSPEVIYADRVLRAELLSATGSSIVSFSTGEVGAYTRTVEAKLKERISVFDYYLAAEATAEGMINRAINKATHVHIPAGVYSIDTAVGIVVNTGTILSGDGKNKTLLSALLGSGGSLAQLASYTKGSVIKRSFNSAAVNAYVNDVVIQDIGIVLNHPEAGITTTAIQIGIDLRNISGATIERCHVGNIPPVGGAITKTYTKPYTSQGYGIITGTVAAVDPAYAGGTKNMILRNSVHGAYKCIVQDESTLSPNSASYATTIRDNDIQAGHWLLAQMGQYGAGNMHVGNTLQDIQKQSGDASTSYVQYYDGYNNVVQPAYIESGSNVDYQLYLDTDANNNKIDMLMASNTSGAGAITDASNANSFNRITHCGLAGITAVVEMYNKAYKAPWVKCHYDGVSAMVLDGASGVVIGGLVRNSVGDYTITWLFAFASTAYNLNLSMATNGSFNLGGWSIRAQNAGSVRFVTYIQVAGITTQIDPTFMILSASQ